MARLVKNADVPAAGAMSRAEGDQPVLRDDVIDDADGVGARGTTAVADWSALVDAIVAGEGARAAAITRKAQFDLRGAAIEILQQLRGESVHASRFIRE